LTPKDIKKLRQDASLLGFFQENHALPTTTTPVTENPVELKDTLPDNLKTEDLIESIVKKLELSREMCSTAIDKLHKHGYVIVSGLKTLKKEGWEKLDLPLAIEEELKTQIVNSRGWTYSLPFSPWAYLPQNGGQSQPGYWTGQYSTVTQAQPLFFPFPSYENQDGVNITDGEIIEDKDDKGRNEKSETEETSEANVEQEVLNDLKEISKPHKR